MSVPAINLRTGKPTVWPEQQPWRTGTDKAEFDCVWNGSWYRLASLSRHLEKKVPQNLYLLVDSRYNSHLVPKDQVTIRSRI